MRDDAKCTRATMNRALFGRLLGSGGITGRCAATFRDLGLLSLAASLAPLVAATPAVAQDPTFDRFILIQPVQVCDDAGNNCAVVDYFHAGTAKALGQANVLPIFLPLSQFNNTALLNSNNGPSDFNNGDGGSADGDTINMWFTGLNSIVDCGGVAAIGCASTPGRFAVIDSQALLNEAGTDPYHRTIAHEIGHNFGLPHVTGAGFEGNLLEVPATIPRSGYYDEIGVTFALLNQDQIDTIRGDGKLQDPDDFNGDGNPNVITVATGTAYQNIFGQGGNDIITLNPGSGVLAHVQGDAGNDIITLNSFSVVGGNVSGGADDDTLTIAGLVLRNVLGDEGNDQIFVLPTAHVVRGVDGGSGTDTIVIDGIVAADPLLPIGPAGLPPVATVPSPTPVKGGIGSDTILLLPNANIAGSVFGDDGNGDEANGDGNDFITMIGGQVAGSIHGEGGDDVITIVDGVVRQFNDGTSTQGGNVLGGGGNDTITLLGGRIAGNVDGEAGDDQISILGGTVFGHVLGGGGNDFIVTAEPGTVLGNIDGGSGNDTIIVASDPLNIFGGIGDDVILIADGAVVVQSVFGDDGDGNEGNGDGNDIIVMTGGSVGANVEGEGGADQINILGGTIGGSVLGGGGADVITLSGGVIAGNIDAGADGDTITIQGGTVTNVLGGSGTDTITVIAGTITNNVDGGSEDDTITIQGGTIGGSVLGGSGTDTITVIAGTITNNVDGGSEDDTITIQGGTIGGSVLGGSGGDTIVVLAGTIGSNVDGGTGGDTINIQGGTIGDSVLGGDGDDMAFWSGGTITNLINMGAGSDTLDIFGVNAGGTALQAGLSVLDGGDDASSADGQVDILNLRGVVEVLTDLQNWEFINLLNNSVGDLGPTTRTIITEQFFIQEGSTLVAQSPVGGQIYTIDGALLNEGLVDMLGNAPNYYDELSVTGVYTGGGASGALFAIDTFLGAFGSPSDLMRVGTATAGVTGIVVNDTNPGPGVFNPIGIDVVRVENAVGGNTAADDFFLVGGPIQKDLWIWDLALDDTRSNPGRANADVHVLYSRPTDIVQFTPYFGTGALTAFHSSLEPWIDRQQTLSDTLALKHSGMVGLKDTPLVERTTYIDVWAAPFGSRRSEDSVSRLSFFGNTFAAQMDYDQNTYGFQAGIDFITKLGYGNAVMAGVFGGFLHSDMSPDAVRVRGEFEGGTVGAYASYVQGGLMLSAVFKADLLDFDWRAPTLDLKASANVDTLGGRVEVAYKHFLTSGGAWLEPYANLTYAKSSWDQFSALATTFAIDDNDSLQGRLGLRVGADVRGSSQTLFKIFAGAGIAHEFKESNTADILSGGFTLPLTHEVDPTSLELQGGLKWTDMDSGLSLSVTSTGRFSEDVQDYGGKATINFRF